MPPLTSDRNSKEAAGPDRAGSVAAGQFIYGGSIVMRNAAGYLVKGEEATGLVGVGRAQARIDNRDGQDGDRTLTYRMGAFLFMNAAGADAISDADSGSLCYALDDQTVGLTDGGGTRSPVGTIDHVVTAGVFVRMNEALTKNFAA